MEYGQAIISVPSSHPICISHLPLTTSFESLQLAISNHESWLANLDWYISTIGGRILSPDSHIFTEYDNETHLALCFRLPGGKGGFGSQLRAQGGRMASQRSTNFEACRDLSGRRLKTVNDAKKLAEYMEKEPEREREKQDKIKKKIADGLKVREVPVKGPSLSKEYVEALEKTAEDVKSAVAKAMAKSSDGKPKSTSSAPTVVKPAPAKKIWQVPKLNDDEDSDEEEEELPPVDPKGKGKAVPKRKAKDEHIDAPTIKKNKK
ncbi:hypothetical protein SmJEL517_g00118 [Synchytrium microbalum]|uniref:SDE2-like domain-containing protein n=1 Tax=Synchytrium microbalum TaxID=1806994 RepID=A0A507CKG7_9FUNG|nr:uncharacterized protein SmJEL517_g00118 [Synchytrium microbalum]TPX38323.1 hypothetical protein SmJEL517_g00118 [Synchytrium microbalum]